MAPSGTLLFIATMIMNFSFAFTAWYTLVVNVTLLPEPLRPGWFARCTLFLSGLFFLLTGTLSTITTLQREGIL